MKTLVIILENLVKFGTNRPQIKLVMAVLAPNCRHCVDGGFGVSLVATHRKTSTRAGAALEHFVTSCSGLMTGSADFRRPSTIGLA